MWRTNKNEIYFSQILAYSLIDSSDEFRQKYKKFQDKIEVLNCVKSY